ncbi:MAG: hypothetical protein QF541_01870 [Lentisphaeria bacterium]|nr:hypothetical protein [Lentisphaeria bacterium]
MMRPLAEDQQVKGHQYQVGKGGQECPVQQWFHPMGPRDVTDKEPLIAGVEGTEGHHDRRQFIRGAPRVDGLGALKLLAQRLQLVRRGCHLLRHVKLHLKVFQRLFEPDFFFRDRLAAAGQLPDFTVEPGEINGGSDAAVSLMI